MKKPDFRSCIVTFLLILAIALIACWFGYVIISNMAYAQDAEPPPPTSADDILYTISHAEDFEVLSIVPPSTEWVRIPLVAHAVVTLPSGSQGHSFFHVAGRTPTWYIPMPNSTDRYMRIQADDSSFENMIVFRAAARLRPYNPDGTEAQGVEIVAASSWWVVRIPATVGRVIFGAIGG